jgi:hypothetical protein
MKKTQRFTKLTLMALSAVAAGVLLYACQDAGVDPAKPSNQLSDKPVVTIGASATDECSLTNIASDRTFDRDTIYILKGDVRVNNGADLTIESGTIIKGHKETQGTLSIERGSRIIANGTDSQPIIFTSSAAPGQRRPQDWGGLNIFGDAPNNLGTNLTPEGFADCELHNPPTHGGENCGDDSGILAFVRIEYAGIPLANVANSEKNALTLYSVGSATQIHHIQVSYGGDDGIEWFGGCVNASYVWALGMTDDAFDSDNGFSGCVQYGVAIAHPTHLDISASNGFESDNNASGTATTPETSAKFSNFTLVGPYDTQQLRDVPNDDSPSSTTARFGDGLHLRRNTNIDVYNSIIVGWRTNQSFVNNQVLDQQVELAYNMGISASDDHVGTPNSNCFTEPASPNNPWTIGGVTNVCDKATAAGDEFTAGTLAQLSGLSSLAWPAVVEVGTASGYFEFEPFTPDVIMPYGPAVSGLTSPVLTTGTDASLISGCFTANTTSAEETTTFFRGALREQFLGDDNGWFVDSDWLEMDPQNEDYIN